MPLPRKRISLKNSIFYYENAIEIRLSCTKSHISISFPIINPFSSSKSRKFLASNSLPAFLLFNQWVCWQWIFVFDIEWQVNIETNFNWNAQHLRTQWDIRLVSWGILIGMRYKNILLAFMNTSDYMIEWKTLYLWQRSNHQQQIHTFSVFRKFVFLYNIK